MLPVAVLSYCLTDFSRPYDLYAMLGFKTGTVADLWVSLVCVLVNMISPVGSVNPNLSASPILHYSVHISISLQSRPLMRLPIAALTLL